MIRHATFGLLAVVVLTAWASAVPTTSPAHVPRLTPQMRAGMHVCRAVVLIEDVGNDDEALKELDHALRLSPKHPEAPALRELVLSLRNPQPIRDAADRDSPRAILLMGLAHAYGRGVEKNPAVAATCYQRAATAGEAEAMLLYGAALNTGSGVQKDAVEAVVWWRKAAAAGSMEATYALAIAYRNGEGLAADPEESVRLFRKLADLPLSSYQRGKARNELGAMYLAGRGVAVDEKAGVMWTTLAAEDGDRSAISNMAIAIARGADGAKRFDESTAWFATAVEAGHGKAANVLGLEFSRKSDHKDLPAAVQWFRKGAELGYVPAIHNLASCYLEGTGVAKDPKEARRWMQTAANRDDEYAIEWLKKNPQ